MQDSTPKKLLLTVLGLVVIVIALFLIYTTYFNKKAPTEVVVVEDPKLNIKYYPNEEIPGDIPKDIPFEEGAVLVRNEMLTSNTSSQIQYARSYFSKKSVKDNYDIFLKYFTDNKYNILDDTLQKDFASINANKEGVESEVQVSVSKNSITGDITVHVISYK